MIISASRRTDIPAFYADWFSERVKDGYLLLKNPFNAHKIKRVSLNPVDVEAIVFWTRNAKPLMKYLPEFDRLGYRYYFQYTITGYPRSLEASVPNPLKAIETFKELSRHIGKERIIWRFDPIVISNLLDEGEHVRIFSKIASMLEGSTSRVVISFLDSYGKVKSNLAKVKKGEDPLIIRDVDFTSPVFRQFVEKLALVARNHGMGIFTCAEKVDLSDVGVPHGKCIDDELLLRVFGLRVNAQKDSGQREECGCIKSIDIGMYNSCLHGCAYCYATQSQTAAMNNYKKHEKESLIMVGRHDPSEVKEQSIQEDLF